jgi:hypothetical protein
MGAVTGEFWPPGPAAAVGGGELSPEDQAKLASLLTVTSIKTSAYTATAGQQVLCDSGSGPFTVTLQMSGAAQNAQWVVLDSGGDAGTNNITVVRSDGGQILTEAGSDTSVVLSNTGDRFHFVYNGAEVIAYYQSTAVLDTGSGLAAGLASLSATASGRSFVTQSIAVNTYAAMTAVNPGAAAVIITRGRTAVGDGGAGVWDFDPASATAANGGTVLAPDTGTGRFLRRFDHIVHTAWFAATDGTGDQGAALTAAGAAAALIAGTAVTANKKCRLVISPGTHRCTTAFSTPANVDIDQIGEINWAGNLTTVAWTIGTGAVENHGVSLRNLRIRGSTVPTSANTNAWDKTGIGILLYNVVSAVEFSISKVQYFQVGVRFVGKKDGANPALGFQKNKNIQLGNFFGCKWPVWAGGDGAGAFFNENHMVGLDWGTGLAAAEDCWGYYQEDVNTAASGNNITMFGMTAQPTYTLSGRRSPFLINSGAIHAWGTRMEGAGPYAGEVGAGANGISRFGVTLFGGTTTQAMALSVLDAGSSGSFAYLDSYGSEPYHRNSWYSGSIKRKANEYNGASGIYVPEVYMVTLASNQYGPVAGLTSAQATAVGNDYIQFANNVGLGMKLIIPACRSIVVRRDIVAGNPGRLFAQLYDSTDAIIDPTGHVTCKEVALSVFNALRTVQGSDVNFPLQTLVFSSTPAVVMFGFVGGTSAIQLRGFGCHVPAQQELLLMPYSDGVGRCTAAPATAMGFNYIAGMRLYRANPTAGQPIGYGCSVTGNPGTWLSMANYA